MPIPPKGWGAVEILIWDQKITLEKLGHEVHIVNTTYQSEILRQVNSFHPDFVLVHYDEYWQVCDKFECDNVAITSHFGYLGQPGKYGPYYNHILNGFLSMRKTRIFALSEEISRVYTRHGFDPNRVSVVPNGARCDLFNFLDECLNPNSSIYLAKIEPRKRQYMFQGIPGLYFAGNVCDARFSTSSHSYLGEFDKDQLYADLTKYANLVLLSDGEAHPLVCLEAMSAGLGLVVSEFAANNLDTTLPFIDVIPESKIHDIEYVSFVIDENRKVSTTMRKEIREYAEANFSWETIVRDRLLPAINKLM
jgi:glycosyltransferase involved in cell wall biosynthesis